ncbi:MAG: DUF1398 family protein [Parvibaculum sp.]|nr:DUF1398 family protein [Parvibaculum sp.]
MNAHAKKITQECTSASDEERLIFPDILKLLMSVGIERYRADLCRSEKAYYLPDGVSCMTPCKPVAGQIAVEFSASGIEAAVRASQAGEIKYGEFCTRIAAAGCTDYIVTLVGRSAIYYGRKGEAHIELFPAAF